MPCSPTIYFDGIGRALADSRPSRSTPDMRVCAVKGRKCDCAGQARVRAGRTFLWPGPRSTGPPEFHPRSDASCAASASSASVTPGAANKIRRLAVSQSDGAGFIEKQGVDIAGGLDRAARHGQHIVLHQAIHAGDADGGEKSADGGGNQADQQRDQHENTSAARRNRWRRAAA